MNKKIVISVGDQLIKFSLKEFDEEINIDDVLKIDYSNLVGEVLTCAVVLNRFGILLSEVENKVKMSKLNLEIYIAKKKEQLRLSNKKKDSKGNLKDLTISELDDLITTDKVFIVKKQKIFDLEKQEKYVNSIYWSLKDKAEKLSKLSFDVNLDNIDEATIERSVSKFMISSVKVKRQS